MSEVGEAWLRSGGSREEEVGGAWLVQEAMGVAWLRSGRESSESLSLASPRRSLGVMTIPVRLCVHACGQYTYMYYHITGNFGVVKFWQNSSNVLLANLIFGDLCT